MKRLQTTQIAAFALFLLIMVLPLRASPGDYTFTNIIDLKAAGLTGSAPIINNAGQVAFAVSDKPVTYNAILRAQPGSVTEIARTTNVGFGGFSMNDSGVVAYSLSAIQAQPTGVYTSDGKTTTIIAQAPGSIWGDFGTVHGAPSHQQQ